MTRRRLARVRGLPVIAAGVMLLACAAAGAETRIAVAANFASCAERLAAGFAAADGLRPVIVTGSTGKLYAQIVNGAPFDALLAADTARPEQLERNGHGVPGSRFTYALGRLVLWSPAPGVVDGRGEVLRSGSFRFLAIANPRLAPYGMAARETLAALGLWEGLQPRLVVGENVAQAYHFVASGNAEIGLVALSQIGRPQVPAADSRWLVPASLYAPIEQQAVALSDSPTARAFLEQLRSAAGRSIIRACGYALPPARNGPG